MAAINSGATIDGSLKATNGETLVSRELGRVTTPYREAERFLAYVRGILEQAQSAVRATAAIPTFFDIRNSAGEQLTSIGKRLGFPRCHCVCDATPVLGFACDDVLPGPPIAGNCESAIWRGCGGVSDYCLNDDEAYRAHLVARRYQMLGLFDLESLGAALRAVWGPRAWAPQARGGRVVVAPGRVLTAAEQLRFMVTLRVLPIAPTMEIAVHYGAAPILGFGAGWSGGCEAAPGLAGTWLCPTVVDPYGCGDAPGPALLGFDCGFDDGPVLAGSDDVGATWAACQ